MNKSNCCVKCKTLAGMAHLVFQCGNPDCPCHQKATPHEIEGWEKDEFLFWVDQVLKEEGYELRDDGRGNALGRICEKVDSLLTHQQERIIAALEGMKVKGTRSTGTDFGDGAYNAALRVAIEVVRGR